MKIGIPSLKEYSRKKSLRNVFAALTKLNQLYFDVYLNTNFLEHKIHYAKLFARARQHLFRTLEVMRTKNQNHQEIIEQVERIYETIFSMHLLRFRVIDFTIFAICREDMQSICDLTTELLQHVQSHLRACIQPKQPHLHESGDPFIMDSRLRGNGSYLYPTRLARMMPVSTDRLFAAIHILETIYHQTLKILSPEPSIFLFFIQDCYTLSDEIENLSNLLWQSSN